MKKYRDFYFNKAKTEHYPARSVYKLLEIDERFKIFSRGLHILDLGAAPGSWTLGAAERIGSNGIIVACDLKMPSTIFPAQIKFFQEDVLTPSEVFIQNLKNYGPFHLVMSDMAPSTTGNKCTDQTRSLELSFSAFEIARKFLIRNGNFIVKIFMGPDSDELLLEMRRVFEKVKIFKPKSSRTESKETFFIGLGKKE